MIGAWLADQVKRRRAGPGRYRGVLNGDFPVGGKFSRGKDLLRIAGYLYSAGWMDGADVI
ncbi:hypothetical protein [Acidiphilium acidophilum]|uniref:Uncharacterized protein n=1 Tax=Acidiphilium acidophilum TaxID=76588 RepID=A0AAW9DPY7_ACIAO|nr:hypothetical protein [Acidiphilium acidophilum]MDX5931166.1 hypothetical protein [Acidiphilium acidophilum]